MQTNFVVTEIRSMVAWGDEVWDGMRRVIYKEANFYKGNLGMMDLFTVFVMAVVMMSVYICQHLGNCTP